MQEGTALTVLQSLGHEDPNALKISDGKSLLVRCGDDKFAAFTRHGDVFDVMTVASDAECPVGTIHGFLQTAIIPMSEEYARRIGIGENEREKLRKRINEATVALDVLAKGQKVRVRSAAFDIHSKVRDLVNSGVTFESIPDNVIDDMQFVNELQSLTKKWTEEMERLQELSLSGLIGDDSVDAEVSFWSSLDAELVNAQKMMESEEVKLTAKILTKHRRTVAFLSEAKALFAKARVRCGGVLVLVQSLPIVPLRTASSEEALLAATENFWELFRSKFELSELPIQRLMYINHAMCNEVVLSLKNIIKERGGLLNASSEQLKLTFDGSKKIFEYWIDSHMDFMKVAKNIAAKKGEKTPESQPFAFLALRKRIVEATDFCSHKNALQLVLKQQIHSDLSAIGHLDAIEEAFINVLNRCNDGVALDTSESGEQTWSTANEAYSAITEDIEQAIGGHYEDGLRSCMDLASMARFASDYGDLLDRPFMEDAINSCTGHVLTAAKSLVSSLRKQWDSYRSAHSTNSGFRHLPKGCSIVIQAKVVSQRLSKVLHEMRIVLGKDLMENNRDISDVVEKVNRMQEEVDVEKHFGKWMRDVQKISFTPSSRLIVVPPSPDASLSLGIESDVVETLESIFFFEQEQRSLGVTLDKDLQWRAINSEYIIAVYISLSTAVDNYNSVQTLLSSLDGDALTTIFPLISDEIDTARKSLSECQQFSWSDPGKKLLEASNSCFDVCRTLIDVLLAFVDEHNFVLETLKGLSGFCMKPEAGTANNEECRKVNDVLERINHTLKSMKTRMADQALFDAYLTDVIKPRLEKMMGSVLNNSIRHWIAVAQNGDLSVFSAILRLSTLGDRYQLEPEGNVLHAKALASLGNLTANVHSLFSSSVSSNLDADDPLRNVGLGPASEALEPGSLAHQASIAAVNFIESELSKLEGHALEWSELAYVFCIDKGQLNSTVSQNVEKASAVFSELDITESKVDAIHQKYTSESDRSAYLNLTNTASLLRTSVIASKRDVLECCGEVGAAESHSVFKNITRCKADISGSVGKSTIDVVLILKDCEESVFSTAHQKIQALSVLEKGLISLPDVLMPATWISSDVLEAELQMLTDMHADKTKSSLGDIGKLKSKFAEAKDALSAKMTTFQKRLENLWVMFGASLSSEEGGVETLTEMNVEESKSLLKSDVGKLQKEARKLGMVEKALNLEESHPETMANSLETQVTKLCTSITSLQSLFRRISGVGSTLFKDFQAVEVRKDVESMLNEVVVLHKLHGNSKLVNYIRRRCETHLSMSGLLGKLRECQLSPLREKDVMYKLFFEKESTSLIMKKRILDFWEVKILDKEDYLNEVFNLAAGESALGEFMNAVRRTWASRKPVFIEKDGCNILDGIPLLIEELQEQLQSLATMATSQYVGLFEEERKNWEVRLSNCADVLEQIGEIQLQWLHLQSLFGAGSGGSGSSLQKKLKEEYTSFCNVDAQIKSVLLDISLSPGLVEGITEASGFDRILGDLNEIVRSLSKFLESQRAAFPRFFFVSDADLLLTLSITPKRMDDLLPVLGKLFPGVGHLKYELTESGSIRATGVLSKEGESLPLHAAVCFQDGASMPDFLSDMDKAMKHSLKSNLLTAVQAFEELIFAAQKATSISLQDALDSFPSQLFLLAGRIVFARKVEEALGKSTDALSSLLSVLSNRLVEICSSSQDDDESRRENKLVTKKREHLIKDLVYQRDTLDKLSKTGVTDPAALEWNQEVRLYMEGDKGTVSVKSRCANSTFPYGWEYLGVGDTLVQTPLTSRCYLTLTQALSRGFGGSPFGPAGTGKTETVKSLGRMFGRNVVVFNCDESFDAVSVGRILAGVSTVGFWVCFDEFNRLSASSLSATSQKLSDLQNAVKNGTPSIDNFYGGKIPIKIAEGLGIFITTNPTYTGRREIPSNLKSLFRPCAMSRPDSLVIAEVLLMSYSFRSCHALGVKLVHMFDSLKRVTRAHPHYDFGLRSLKSAIIVAGFMRKNTVAAAWAEIQAKSQEKQDSSDEEGVTGAHVDVDANVDEELVVVLSLHESLKPRLLPQDVHEYNGYVQNLFPKVTAQAGQLPDDLMKAIISACKDHSLKFGNAFLERVGQLYNVLKYRPGVIVVGDAGCGKSTTWKILFESMRRVSLGSLDLQLSCNMTDKKSSLTVIDPKLLSSAQLYGSLDPLTREWTDGIFTKCLRNCMENSADTSENFLHWIVFDGDIDPNWVENLNSVLDDTRLLTLPSGERIPLSPKIRIIFEVDSLEHANPSTVSRCGLVYLDQGEDMADILKCRWDNIMDNVDVEKTVKTEILKLVEPYCEFAQNLESYGNGIMKQPVSSFVNGTTLLFSSILNQVIFSRPSDDRSGANLTTENLVYCFLFSAKTAIGSRYTTSVEEDVYTGFLEKMAGVSGFLDRATDGYYGNTLIGTGLNVENCTPFSLGSVNSEKVELPCIPQDIGSPDIVIPTPSTTRLTRIVHNAIWNEDGKHDHHSLVVLCGPPGCGKSMVLSSTLKEMPGVELATISMSSRTTVDDVIAVMRTRMELSKGVGGELILKPPPHSKQTVLFCDEVNLGEPDEFGTQHIANFLRSIVENSGFWSGTPARWTKVQGLQVVAACNPAVDAGRHELPDRLMRHAVVVCVEQPDESDLMTIFQVHMSAFCTYLNEDFGRDWAESVTACMVGFFLDNKDAYSPENRGPLQPHYIYSARELIRWVRGLKRLLISEDEDDVMGMTTENSDQIRLKVVNALAYEAKRLFIDRLVTEEEADVSNNMLASHLSSNMGVEIEVLNDDMYTRWLAPTAEDMYNENTFKKVTDEEAFRNHLYHKLRTFGEEEGLGGAWVSGRGVSSTHDALDTFAVTDVVLKHLVRIERILSQPLGHAVLMGVPGTGKKTMARFAAWMCGASVFQVRSHANYTADDFANDLRGVLRQAGVHHVSMVVLFDESNDLDSAFLEMMNSILACGDVPGLFEGDERDSLLKEMKTTNRRTGIADVSNEALYSKFLDGVRKNLHVIFSIPIVKADTDGSNDSLGGGGGKDMTSRSPALYNRCVVDWFGEWDDATLDAVATLKMELGDPVLTGRIAHVMAGVHLLTDKENLSPPITPRHFLEFVEQFNRIVHEKGYEIEQRGTFLSAGLHKLREAGQAVDNLKESLVKKAQTLKKKEKVAEKTLGKIKKESTKAEKSKGKAAEAAAWADEAVNGATVQAAEVEKRLAGVEPKVREAREAINGIEKKHLDELRSMPNPPSHVKTAIEVVMYMLDGAKVKPSEVAQWKDMRSKMQKDFIPAIQNFDIDGLSKSQRNRIQTKINKSEDFNVDRVMRASRAAGPLALYTVASLEYAAVSETVEPLRAEVEDLKVQAKRFEKQSADANAEVKKLVDKINEFQAEYKILVAETGKMRKEIAESEAKVRSAEQMLDSLGNEWDRWINDLKACNENAKLVPGTAIYAAAFVAYAGPLDQQQRKRLKELWVDFICGDKEVFFNLDTSISVSNYLTTPGDRSFWTQQQLPVDETSLENYAILLRSARYPLIVDPSGKSSELLQKILRLGDQVERAPNKLPNAQPPLRDCSITSFTLTGKNSYIRAVEAAVKFGVGVLIQHAERFDNSCLPLLGQESSFGNLSSTSISNPGTVKRAQQRMVRLGDRDTPISPGFRLFMSSTNIAEVPNAAISRSSVVSFVLSPAALQSKCVSRTLRALHPAVEEQRAGFMIAAVRFVQEKEDLEDSLLVEIRNSKDMGAQVMGGPLKGTLEKLKRESKKVLEEEEKNKVLAEEATVYEERYKELALASLRIFNVLVNLRSIDPLYRFSPMEFFDLFDKALSEATKDGNPAPSSGQIYRELVRVVYSFVVPSLFPSHKVAFGCTLVLVASQYNEKTANMKISSEIFSDLRARFAQISQTNFTVPSSVIRESDVCRQLGFIISEDVDDEENIVFAKQSAAPLNDLLSIGCNSAGELPKLFDKLGCVLPGGKETLNGAKTRVDVVLSEIMKSLVTEEDRNTKFRPLLLCSRGANSDPCESTLRMANELGVVTQSIALSNEYTREVTETMLKRIQLRAQREPVLLLLKNIHLASREIIEYLKLKVASSQNGFTFLLVLVAEVGSFVQPFFDLSDKCRVLAFETPPSLRTNLSRCHAVLNASFDGDEWLRRTYIAVTWLHGALLERRQYAPVGFSKPYDFTEGDLLAAWDVVNNHRKSGSKLDKARSVAALIQLLATTVYGGRVENTADSNVLLEFISDLFYRVLVHEDSAAQVPVVDSALVQTNITVPVDDPLMSKVVESLPLLAPTDWFGMHSKTSESYKEREGKTTLDTVLALTLTRLSAKASAKADQSINQLKRTIDTLDNLLPSGRDSVHEPCKDVDNALFRFLEREEQLCMECIYTIQDDLDAVLEISGARASVRASSLLKAAKNWDSHGSAFIPKEWTSLQKYAGGVTTIRSLFLKFASCAEWLTNFKMKERSIDLSSVLRPTALISALGQAESKEAKVPETDMFPILGPAKSSPGTGWAVEGLSFEGGTWDTSTGYMVLSESDTKAPACKIWWYDEKTRKEHAKKNGYNFVSIPLYDSPARERLVAEVYVPVDPNVSVGKWRLSATAIIITASSSPAAQTN